MLTTTSLKSRAFSLMEIMVAVIIIGVLSFIAVPKLFDLVSGSQDSASEESAKAIVREAVGNAAINNAGYDDDSSGGASYLEDAVESQGGAAKFLLCNGGPPLAALDTTDAVNDFTAADTTFTIVDVGGEKRLAVTMDAAAPGASVASVVLSEGATCA